MNQLFRWLLAAGSLGLAGCGSGPPPRVYVLGAAVNPIPGVTSEAGLPVVELKPVSLPDYLDTTDIQLRDGQNELKSSATGRWGERLSVGIAAALREDLTKQVPGIVVIQARAGAGAGAHVAGQYRRIRHPPRRDLRIVRALDDPRRRQQDYPGQPEGHDHHRCATILRRTDGSGGRHGDGAVRLTSSPITSQSIYRERCGEVRGPQT